MKHVFSTMIVSALVSVLAGCGLALAADAVTPVKEAAPVAPATKPFKLIEEFRFGINDHNPMMREKGTVDLSGELLSSRIFDFGKGDVMTYLSPRLNLGGALNTAGKTSYVFAGVAWNVPLFDKFFIEGQFGGAAHNGSRDPSRANLGECHWSFREAAILGYQINENWSVMADVEHLSHLNNTLCPGGNGGLTNFGVKVGYTF